MQYMKPVFLTNTNSFSCFDVERQVTQDHGSIFGVLGRQILNAELAAGRPERRRSTRLRSFWFLLYVEVRLYSLKAVACDSIVQRVTS